MTFRKRLLLAAVLLALLVGIPSAALAEVNAACAPGTSPFPDVPYTSGFCSYILRLYNLNITQGYSDGTYKGTNNVTRYEMAAYLDRLTQAYTTANEPFIFRVDHQYVGSTSNSAIEAISDSGTGVRGYSDGAGGNADNGVYGSTTSTDANEAGVWGYNSGTGAGTVGTTVVNNTTSYGGRFGSAFSHGLYSLTWGGAGSASIYAGYFTGDVINAASGIRAIGSGGGNGVNASSENADAGHFVASANDGVYGSATGGAMWGLWGQSNDSYGVYANTSVSGGYGMYTGDNIYVGGSCTGCVLAMVGQNGGDADLAPGDLVMVVGVTASPSPDATRPVLLLQKAAAGATAGIVGVVQGRYDTQLVTKEVEHFNSYIVEQDPGEETPDGAPIYIPVEEVTVEEITVEDAKVVAEPAASGQYVTVIYSGLVQVSVDAGAGAIKAGDTLVAGPAGLAVSLQSQLAADPAFSGKVLGTAAEALDVGTGLIWVLLDLR